MDVDFAARKALIEIARGDRRVRLHVDGDRAFFERFRAEWIDVPTGRRGDRFLARRLSVTFLGRTRGSTPREAVMLFAQYAVDNADVALPAGGVARQIAAAAGLR